MFCINSQQVIHVVNILCDTIVKMFPADTTVHNSAAADGGANRKLPPPSKPSEEERNLQGETVDSKAASLSTHTHTHSALHQSISHFVKECDQEKTSCTSCDPAVILFIFQMR